MTRKPINKDHFDRPTPEIEVAYKEESKALVAAAFVVLAALIFLAGYLYLVTTPGGAR